MGTQTKKCPKCGEEISSKASKCPKCQSDLRKWPAKHPILTIIICIFALSLINAAFSSNGTQVAPANKPAQQATAPANEPTPCECRISEWKITGDVFSGLTLNGVCWQSNPISLAKDADCLVLQRSLNDYMDIIELDENDPSSESYLEAFSKELLTCAKVTNNEKLRQVAKSCNGKWY